MFIIKKNEEKRKLNQFYTKRKIADLCVEILKREIEHIDKYFFIEPSAGEGVFLDFFNKKNILGFDIDPKSNNIIKKDFLKIDIKEYSDIIRRRKIIVIGNPPFGKNSSLAVKFINKSAEFSDYTAFILPKTFKKDSIKNRLNKHLFLIKEIDLPENSFIFNKKEYNVPCIFQIRKKNRKKNRKIERKKLEHSDFQFVKKEDNPDFAIRRVGVKAGTIFTKRSDINKYAKASHYYLKVKINKVKFLNIYNSIKWDKYIYNTSGNPSLSKTELIESYKEMKMLNDKV